MNSAASAIMVAEEEAAAVLLVEHTREALAESEENVSSYLEQYERLISSFLAIDVELPSWPPSRSTLVAQFPEFPVAARQLSILYNLYHVMF
jgi:hypothetical protein